MACSLHDAFNGHKCTSGYWIEVYKLLTNPKQTNTCAYTSSKYKLNKKKLVCVGKMRYFKQKIRTSTKNFTMSIQLLHIHFIPTIYDLLLFNCKTIFLHLAAITNHFFLESIDISLFTLPVCFAYLWFWFISRNINASSIAF